MLHQESRIKNFINLGFTLSELLVSLTVLGLIAGLTVPSMVNSVVVSKRLALLKETKQVLQSIVTEGIQNGDLRAASSWTDWTTINANRAYLRSKLNATKVCPSNAVTEGCIGNTSTSGVDPHVATSLTGYAQVLPNGVTIASGGNAVAQGGVIVIDMNNKEGPNKFCSSSTDSLGSCDSYAVSINFSEDTDFIGGYGVGKKQSVIIEYGIYWAPVIF
jgi:prepilin-type N-terminal cleavage/methylation domain-containing protein